MPTRREHLSTASMGPPGQRRGRTGRSVLEDIYATKAVVCFAGGLRTGHTSLSGVRGATGPVCASGKYQERYDPNHQQDRAGDEEGKVATRRTRGGSLPRRCHAGRLGGRELRSLVPASHRSCARLSCGLLGPSHLELFAKCLIEIVYVIEILAPVRVRFFHESDTDQVVYDFSEIARRGYAPVS